MFSYREWVALKENQISLARKMAMAKQYNAGNAPPNYRPPNHPQPTYHYQPKQPTENDAIISSLESYLFPHNVSNNWHLHPEFFNSTNFRNKVPSIKKLASLVNNILPEKEKYNFLRLAKLNPQKLLTIDSEESLQEKISDWKSRGLW